MDVIEWLLENGKISPSANVSVDVALFNHIFDRLNICLGERTKLLGALANCAHLNLDGECPRGFSAMYGNALSNASFIKMNMKMNVEMVCSFLYKIKLYIYKSNFLFILTMVIKLF
jgi:hypothetical protein